MMRMWIGACAALWCIGTTAGAQVSAKPSAAPAKAAEAATAIKSPGELDADMIDLNSASASALRALPGIGDAYAEKIIKGRPYDRKDELVRRGILPKAVYKKMQNRVVARHTKP